MTETRNREEGKKIVEKAKSLPGYLVGGEKTSFYLVGDEILLEIDSPEKYLLKSLPKEIE